MDLIPNMSSITNTCPSQYFEDPIPIVGIFIFEVISLATSVTTHSKSKSFDPASSNLKAKSNNLFFSSSVLPATLIFEKSEYD